MIPKKQRIGRQKILDLQRNKPISVNGRLFSVKFWPSENSQKIAVLVSKKVSKLATKRNLVKRKTVIFCLKIFKNKGFLIFYPKKEFLSSKTNEIQEDLLKINKELHSLLDK